MAPTSLGGARCRNAFDLLSPRQSRAKRVVVAVHCIERERERKDRRVARSSDLD